MSVKLKVYTNEDDALLYWSIAAPLPECRGFAIERRKTDTKKKKTQGFLENHIGFEKEDIGVEQKEGQEAITKPSTEWPFQRFSWTDHDATTGDTVSYRVAPVVRNKKGALETADDLASPWSDPKLLGVPPTEKFKPYFNRGFVMAQFMARYLANNHLTLKQFKAKVGDPNDKTIGPHNENIRTFLSGDLRLALLAQLQTAKDQKTDVYAALFELSDDELIAALLALGKKAHVVLSNGSITKSKTETTEEAHARDENASARAKLIAAGVDVAEHDRFTSPGPLGHNKFLVRTDKLGKPVMAWTGSTNWAPTGLCTQINNGLLIEDAEIAQIYLDQWNRLRKAKSAFPPTLVSANSKPKDFGKEGEGNVRGSVWFSRTSKGVDLAALTAEVQKAREGILFLMFMPGASGLFSTVAARSAEPNLYVRGVVSELPHGRGDESAVDVNLIDGSSHAPLHLDIIQPEGVQHALAKFAAEVTHKQFLAGIGHAIIHSKVVVIDPFSPDPVVITGSHNFSASASSKNDENFIIVRGDHVLAEAYAVNILAAYQHYRWRASLAQAKKPFNGTKDNDQWQAPMLASQRRDLQFWGV
jgi:phosphatidylserine/phosphatidylglycerophosphate/cardiolipin synthase-like enzyme